MNLILDHGQARFALDSTKWETHRAMTVTSDSGEFSLSSRVSLVNEGTLIRTRMALVLSGALLGVAGGAVPVPGQNPLTRALLKEATSTSTNSLAAPLDAEVSRKAVEERLARARKELSATPSSADAGSTNRPQGVSLQQMSLRRAFLKRLVHIYEQQISYTAELETAKARRAQFVREAQTWTGFSEPRPYSILLVDGLLESIQVEQRELANGESALSMLAALIEEHRVTLKQAEEHIRQINEQLERNRRAETASELTAQGDLEKLRSQVAAGTMTLLELERQIRQERVAASRVHLGLLERQLVRANAGAIFTASDMENLAARLEGEQRQLEGELADADSRGRAAAKALYSDEEAWRRIRAEPGVDPSASARAAEQVEVRRTQLETAETAATVLRFLLEAGNVERAIWEMRFASYQSRDVEALGRTAQRLKQYGRRVEIWKKYFRQKLEGASGQVALQETRLAGLETNSDLAPLARERLAALRERDQFLLRIVRKVERDERLIQRLSEGLREAAGNLPLTGRVRNAASSTGAWFSRLWHLELFAAQDTITVDGQSITGKRSVTLGKIISAILILVVGYWLTGLIARFMESLINRRFKIDANQANLIRRWVRVVLVVSLALFSLVSVKIPLTVFAFAGGALAIALGFGMQTLLKNFVCGVIILFERPFRVGDVLDVAGQRGPVVSVGIRSSVLQLWDGTETLIPNSALLENTVTNWTYSDRKVRFTISVRVAYGSNTRQVVQLLTEIAERHGLVEKDPAPQILFVDFAESSLAFEMRFWVDVIRCNAAQISSDLRHMIASTLTEHDIVIASPQREIRMQPSPPLQVQLLPALDGAGSPESAQK